MSSVTEDKKGCVGDERGARKGQAVNLECVYSLRKISCPLNLSFSLNILCVTFSHNISCRDHIFSLARTASKNFISNHAMVFFIQGSHSPLYGVWLSCEGCFNIYVTFCYDIHCIIFLMSTVFRLPAGLAPLSSSR